jgi:hypothetical protein
MANAVVTIHDCQQGGTPGQITIEYHVCDSQGRSASSSVAVNFAATAQAMNSAIATHARSVLADLGGTTQPQDKTFIAGALALAS